MFQPGNDVPMQVPNLPAISCGEGRGALRSLRKRPMCRKPTADVEASEGYLPSSVYLLVRGPTTCMNAPEMLYRDVDPGQA